MIPDSALRRAMNDRADALFNVYQRERQLGADPLTANERMMQFAKRLDAAHASVADDAFNRDLAIIKSVMERSR